MWRYTKVLYVLYSYIKMLKRFSFSRWCIRSQIFEQNECLIFWLFHENVTLKLKYLFFWKNLKKFGTWQTQTLKPFFCLFLINISSCGISLKFLYKNVCRCLLCLCRRIGGRDSLSASWFKTYLLTFASIGRVQNSPSKCSNDNIVHLIERMDHFTVKWIYLHGFWW